MIGEEIRRREEQKQRYAAETEERCHRDSPVMIAKLCGLSWRQASLARKRTEKIAEDTLAKKEEAWDAMSQISLQTTWSDCSVTSSLIHTSIKQPR